MKKIEYIEKYKKDIEIIAPLWDKLRKHHKARSQHFKKQFDEITWEKRRKDLLEKCNNGSILVHLAKDKETGALIGFCVSTVNKEKIGEVESIYIEKEYRKMGIGANFMKRTLKWMDSHSAARKVIAVAAGNEEAFGFYSKYGFYPRVSILTQVESK